MVSQQAEGIAAVAVYSVVLCEERLCSDIFLGSKGVMLLFWWVQSCKLMLAGVMNARMSGLKAPVE